MPRFHYAPRPGEMAAERRTIVSIPSSPIANVPESPSLAFANSTVAQLASAVALDPENLERRLEYVRLLIQSGDYRSALVEIEEGSRRALRSMLTAAEPDRKGFAGSISIICSDQVGAVHQLGLLLDRSNQVDGLRQLLAAALVAGIAPKALGYLSASIALRDGQPEEARRLLLEDHNDVDPQLWHRLMAKIADALDDADGAFEAAGKMNRAAAHYEAWRQRAAKYRFNIRLAAQVVTPEWAGGVNSREAASDQPAPAFLVGFPRSGTTLLDTFLMGHPQTCVVEEGKMLEKATGVISDRWDKCWPADLIMDARRVYFEELSRHVPGTFTGLIIDKHPLNMLRLAVIYALFPTAKIIFAQRHPCDIVLSAYMQNFALNPAMACFLNLNDAADLYDAAMTMWTRSRNAFPRPVHSVVYERLIADPRRELRATLRFLDLDWREEILDHQSTARSRGAIITPSHDQVLKPLSQAPIGRWLRYRKAMEPVLPKLLPWAERMGYADGQSYGTGLLPTT